MKGEKTSLFIINSCFSDRYEVSFPVSFTDVKEFFIPDFLMLKIIFIFGEIF